MKQLVYRITNGTSWRLVTQAIILDNNFMYVMIAGKYTTNGMFIQSIISIRDISPQ